LPGRPIQNQNIAAISPTIAKIVSRGAPIQLARLL